MGLWMVRHGRNRCTLTSSMLLHGAKNEADCTQEHNEHGKLWREQLVLSGSVDMVVHKDHRSSSPQEPVREPHLLARVHVASYCAPFNLLIHTDGSQSANMSYNIHMHTIIMVIIKGTYIIWDRAWMSRVFIVTCAHKKASIYTENC